MLDIEIKIENYLYIPKEDITVYELALIIPALVHSDIELIRNFSQKAKRHFLELGKDAIQVTLVFKDEETRNAIILPQQDKPYRPVRYKVFVPNGLSVGEYDAEGNEILIFDLIFPCDNSGMASTEFIRRIEKLRRENRYYGE